ncbi:hypothetical protein HGA13_18040 [Nocardia speluncae]|uniref:Uncharacterized protein n=1 Tax=Nocardia speluncae TaxID=419477 RepID=A0A846XHJ4_9NOCA|nr:hypothetical protein [Nocardia speluncae]
MGALPAGLVPVEPAVAYASVQLVAADHGMTSGRLGPTLTALMGLLGLIAGVLALVRAIGSRGGKKQAIIALVLGTGSLALGALFAAQADGGPGTGNGIVGAWLAMLLGVLGLTLAVSALVRTRSRTV